ncbi:unnamed protein product, partial [Prorocentrum cordatum]
AFPSPLMYTLDGVASGRAGCHPGALAGGPLGKALDAAPARGPSVRQGPHRALTAPGDWQTGRVAEMGTSHRMAKVDDWARWPDGRGGRTAEAGATAPGVWKTGRAAEAGGAPGVWAAGPAAEAHPRRQGRPVGSAAPRAGPGRAGRQAFRAPPGLSRPAAPCGPPAPTLAEAAASEGAGGAAGAERSAGARVQRGPATRPAEIIWCAESTGEWASELRKHAAGIGLQGELMARGGLSSSILSVPKFTRWMFNQMRGPEVVPWVTLVVGWREAKPCVDAVEAAATGRDSRLRQDSSRMLRAATGDTAGAARVQVAVSTVIIAAHDARQKARADRLVAARSGAGAAPKSDPKILVALGADELRALLAAAVRPAAGDGPAEASLAR